ncbi:MAG: DUF4126 domain-containing protein [Synechococcales bacterium]|nr:DUF4126 domain-containing protein [Synechococcales bacterium]
MIEILLAVLSISAAAGLRIALPLLMIGILSGTNLWVKVPILSAWSPPWVLGILVSWSLFEFWASKNRSGNRLLQSLQIFLSPLVGWLVGVAIAQAAELQPWLINLLGIVSALLAMVLQLVQVGWFYRLRGGLPLWASFGLDGLCALLVLFALDAPQQGGLIALLLLWFAIRSSQTWRDWYKAQAQGGYGNPRAGKLDPD